MSSSESCATPIETRTGSPTGQAGRSRARSIRSPRTSATRNAAWRSVSGSSGDELLASVARASSRRVEDDPLSPLPTACSTESPTAWPRESLMSLKWSMSMKSTGAQCGVATRTGDLREPRPHPAARRFASPGQRVRQRLRPHFFVTAAAWVMRPTGRRTGSAKNSMALNVGADRGSVPFTGSVN